MKRFSRLFYFTVIGGLAATVLLHGLILCFLHHRPEAIGVLCRAINPDCRGESLYALYVTTCAVYTPVTSLVFWAAYRTGRRFQNHHDAPTAAGSQ
jgi:hypothetical protein